LLGRTPDDPYIVGSGKSHLVVKESGVLGPSRYRHAGATNPENNGCGGANRRAGSGIPGWNWQSDEVVGLGELRLISRTKVPKSPLF